MEDKKEDLRIIRTKEAVQKVFKEMIFEIPYEKITVKVIAERAGINRNTFYLHYNSVDDVLKEIQNKYSDEYSNLISKYNINKDTVMLVRTFFEYMESQDDFFIKITCDSRFDYIRERMQSKVDKKLKGQKEKLTKADYIQSIINIYNTTVLYLYRQWVEVGRKIPLEEMINLAATLLDKGMQGVRK